MTVISSANELTLSALYLYVEDHSNNNGVFYRSVVDVITEGGDRIQVGVGPKRRNSSQSAEMVSLAKEIAAKSGANLELR